MNHSPYKHVPTFSEVHGLREVPGPPQLEEISPQARNNLWSALWKQMEATSTADFYSRDLGRPWQSILAVVHQRLLGQPLDQFETELRHWQNICKSFLLEGPYHLCFDMIETLMRHPECPEDFTREIAEIFHYQLAYRIDTTSTPRIVPAATEQEGDALIGALHDLERARLGGAATHLRQAGERIREQDWAGSIRESIHAVESVATRVTGGDADTLGKALSMLERQADLHGALRKGFGALYGYASNEDGIRHSLSDNESKATQDEAIFMIGACAAFCSYLWRKFGSENAVLRPESH